MGASTITMQLARLRNGLYTKSVRGKLHQIIRAIFLEICFSKDEILEAYLNRAPMGGNIEGYATASWYYFGKRPRDLTLSQRLSLVVIPQNPQARAPSRVPDGEAFMAARAVLYASWLAEHPDDAVFASELSLPPHLVLSFPARAPHHSELLARLAAQEEREGGGLKSRYGLIRGRIESTLDLARQDLVEAAVEQHLREFQSFGVRNASLLLVDHRTGEVRAAVGSADWHNLSIQGMVNGNLARRSPGSTLKPFIYGLALDAGLIHPFTMLRDSPMSFNEYSPDNFQSIFKGPVSATEALCSSRNIPAVALERELRQGASHTGLYQLLEAAGVQGLKGEDHYGLSIVLGSAELSMVELVALYAALANGGVQTPLVLSRAPYTRLGRRARILSKEAAWVVQRMLEENPPVEKLRPATSQGVPVAWKTGTSIGFKDAWSIALFDRYVLAVWVGNFDGTGNNSFVGRHIAAPLMFQVIDSILAETPDTDRFVSAPHPEGVRRVAVCPVSGGIPGEDCPYREETWFIPGVSPIDRCSIHRAVWVDTETGYRSEARSGPHIKRVVREFWPSDLMALFEAAGLPRLVPPQWPPDEPSLAGGRTGFPPRIVSPLNGMAYVLSPEADRSASARPQEGSLAAVPGAVRLSEGGADPVAGSEIALRAYADADVKELYWFANERFLGRTGANEVLLWRPVPGAWAITVVDGRGRSDARDIVVETHAQQFNPGRWQGERSNPPGS